MDVETGSETHWRYESPEHSNAKMLLLTKAGIATIGRWGNGLGVIAWCPLPKRDKLKEKQNDSK